ncbi:phytanoyl-CoA dioxygenase family protein [Hwanghaeella sp.]|uniref:phytanoyl-CoA dioxygenase family protein n=1 Tax=Hwanghaeella sp. TaxID=2605943 RepID=UPI003CCBEFDC
MQVSEFKGDDYWRDGYAFPIDVLTAAEAQAVRKEVEAFEASPPEGLTRPLAKYLRTNAHIVLPTVARMARHPQVIDAVKKVLGPDLLCWGAEFFTKEAHTNKVVTWHQDLTYWGLGYGDQEVTAWIALSPATVESGCMKFVAGSHKNEIQPHVDTFDENNLLSRGQEMAVKVNEEDEVPVILMPGQMSLHHGRMFHASGPNVSDDRRMGLVIRFITPEMKQQNAGRDYAMPVCGADTHRNFEYVPDPVSAFSPESVALYDEVMAEHAKIMAQGSEKKIAIYS